MKQYFKWTVIGLIRTWAAGNGRTRLPAAAERYFCRRESKPVQLEKWLKKIRQRNRRVQRGASPIRKRTSTAPRSSAIPGQKEMRGSLRVRSGGEISGPSRTSIPIRLLGGRPPRLEAGCGSGSWGYSEYSYDIKPILTLLNRHAKVGCVPSRPDYLSGNPTNQELQRPLALSPWVNGEIIGIVQNPWNR